MTTFFDLADPSTPVDGTVSISLPQLQIEQEFVVSLGPNGDSFATLVPAVNVSYELVRNTNDICIANLALNEFKLIL